MKDSKQILEYVIEQRDEILNKRKIRRNIIISVAASAACICIAVFSVKTLIPDTKHTKVPIAEVTLSENIPVSSDNTNISSEDNSKNRYDTPSSKAAVTEAVKTSSDDNSSVSSPLKAEHSSGKATEKPVTAASGGNSTSAPKISGSAPGTTTQTSEELYIIPSWNEKEIYEQFTGFSFNNSEYVTRCCNVPAGMTGEKLGEIKISGQDFNTLEMHEADVSLFKIKDFSPNCALAVQFKGNSNFYSYTSSSYFPDTLGKMLDDTNFEKNAVFGDLYLKYSNISAKSFDAGLLMEILKDNRNAVCISDDHDYHPKYSVSVSIPAIGITGKSFKITEDGFIVTNIFEYQHAYYIGKDQFDRFTGSIEFDDSEPAAIDYGVGEEE